MKKLIVCVAFVVSGISFTMPSVWAQDDGSTFDGSPADGTTLEEDTGGQDVSNENPSEDTSLSEEDTSDGNNTSDEIMPPEEMLPPPEEMISPPEDTMPAAETPPPQETMPPVEDPGLPTEQPSDSPVPAPTGSGMVTLTFDDGWSSQYENALPILNSAGINATFYINTTPILEGWVDYMTPAQIQSVEATGNEIGNHTRTHAHLVGLSDSELQNEIAGARDDFSQLGLSAPSTFAYPYGESDGQVQSTVMEVGNIAGRGVDSGFNTSSTNVYNLLIQQVVAGTSVDTVDSWIDEADSTGSWLILLFHQIDNSGTEYGTTPEVLQGIVDHLSQTQTPTVTVRDGVGRL